MVINNSFTFGGVDSSNYGIYIAGDAVYNSPERDVTMLTVPGRNGQLTIDNGRFENIEVTYPCFIEKASGQTDIASAIRAFRNDLGALTGYQRLEDTYHTDEYREGIFRAGLDIKPVVYHTGGEFEVTFDCKPQRWLTLGETPITLTPGTAETINNPTSFDSQPFLAIEGGAGKHISFAYLNDMNIYRIEMSNGLSVANPPLYIDCELQEAYEIDSNGVITSHNADVSFVSPNAGAIYMKSQTVVVVFTGITSATITPRWWRI